MKLIARFVQVVFLGLLTGAVHAASPPSLVQSTINIGGQPYQVQVPQGMKLEWVARLPGGPRVISMAPDKSMFIGTKTGAIYRLRLPYNSADIYAELDGYPHSIAFRDGKIYIARTAGVSYAPFDPAADRLDVTKLKRLLPLPGGGGHTSRTIKTGPDGRIYVSLGITGNCSDEYLDESYTFEDRRGGVLVLDESGDQPQWKTYASGLRNPIGFDWRPSTGVMYASNNGPDHLGYDEPPEYFSRITAGSFHGMPWFQLIDGEIVDDDCVGSEPPRPRSDVPKPVATFPARNAPMDVAFIQPDGLNGRFANDAVVALHGSWATQPSGGYFGDRSSRRHPKLVLVQFEGKQVTGVHELVTGFQLENGKRWARPMGVVHAPDGALYFTSDGGFNGLFRLTKQ